MGKGKGRGVGKGKGRGKQWEARVDCSIANVGDCGKNGREVGGHTKQNPKWGWPHKGSHTGVATKGDNRQRWQEEGRPTHT